MIRALFTATDGMIIQERRQAVISNNLSNSNTTGFKKQDLFSKEMNKQMVYFMDKTGVNQYTRQNIGTMSLGSEVDEIYFNFEQGMLQDTDKPTDLALEGQGFFKVQWNGGVGYTRNGNFRINADGYLTMQDGVTRLLGTNAQTGAQEPILVGDRELKVNSRGEVSLDGQLTHRLDIVNIQPGVNIEAIGNSIFTVAAGNEIPANGTLVRQEQIERSNVNVIDEMVKMIETSRSYESGQRVVTALDNTLGKVMEIGRVR